MRKLLIEFDRSSLVIPNEDYDIFKNENYHIDDGTKHVFFEDCNGLLILNTDKKPDNAIFFSKVVVEGETKYEICRIKKALYKDISPQTDIEGAQNAVISIIKETFILLDGILKNEQNPSTASNGSALNITFLKKEYLFIIQQ